MLELDQLYAAVDDNKAFEAMPEAIAAMCGGRSATITRIDARGALSYTRMSYFQPEHVTRYYSEGWVENDPWADAVNVNPGCAVLADGILPPQRFFRTAMYNELFRSIGDDTARCVGLVSASRQDTVILGVHRPGSARAFTPQNAALLDRALLQVRRIFRSRDAIAYLEAERSMSEAMLDNAGRAMMIVDRTLRIRCMTKLAKSFLDRADGIRCITGRLALGESVAQQALLAAVKSVVSQSSDVPCALLCSRSSTPLSYRVVILPMGDYASDCALVIVDDPTVEQDEDRLRRFTQAYALTSAESALVRGLTGDQPLDEIAAVRRVTKETIRTQLKSLFLKVGVRRQIALMKLITNMP